MKNYYKILGTDQTATAHEIKQAHKALLAKYGSSDAHEKGYTAERYIDIAIAYETLVHAEKRTEYDRILNSVLPPPQENPKQQKAPEANPEMILVPKSRHNPVRYGLYIGMLLIVLTAITFIQVRKIKTPDAAGYTAQATSTSSNSIQQSLKDIRQQDKQQLSVPEPKSEPATVAVLPSAAPAPDKAVKSKNEVRSNTPAPKQLAVAASPNKIRRTTDIASEPETISPVVAPPQIGTTKKEVLRALGTPRAIVRYDNDNEIWRYSNKNIYFSSNKIISFNEGGNNRPGESHYE